jgi:hypothetical protein
VQRRMMDAVQVFGADGSGSIVSGIPAAERSCELEDERTRPPSPRNGSCGARMARPSSVRPAPEMAMLAAPVPRRGRLIDGTRWHNAGSLSNPCPIRAANSQAAPGG